MKKTSLPKDEIKILLLEGVHPRAVESLRAQGYSQIEYHEKSLPEAQLCDAIRDAHLVGLRSRTQITAEVLDEARKLIAVGCFCIGTNQVELVHAQNLGIPVFNAPYSNTRSVAELVLGEAIMLMRRIPEKSAAAHRGEWLKTASGAFEIRDKTIGIVGYGHIGTQIGLLAEGLGMRVLYYDIDSKLALGNARSTGSLDELLSKSDVVTLHVPETGQTRNLIGARQLAKCKPGAILINASRGTVVDIAALCESLRDGRLSGAAIDVFPVEPKSNQDEFLSPLREFDNVILTPHIGGSTVEAQENIGLEVADKLIRYSDNGSTLSSVNFPEVSLPPHPGSHRLLHIHRNVPGVLSKVNDAFSQGRINIDAQYLQTNPTIGYVVIDIDTDEDTALNVRERLSQIDGTIRTRILY